MKPAIRALGIATIMIWIILIVFVVTALYSVMRLGIGFGEPQFFPSSMGIVLSLPFSLNNSGYYDISKLNITTSITDSNGTTLSMSDTFVPLVSKGSNVEAAHNITIELSDVMENIGLLFNDSFFVFDTFVSLNFAHFVPVQLSMNMTVPWGAPFHNLSVGEIQSNNDSIVVPLSFENHSFFDITGTIELDVYNDVNELVATGESSLDAPSQQPYEGQIDMPADVSKLTESGRVHFIFWTPIFAVERWVPYG